MKFHQFLIISLCNFIVLVCYTSKAQTVGGPGGGMGVIYDGPSVVNESDQFSLTCFASHFSVFKWRRNGNNVHFANLDGDDSHSHSLVEGRNDTLAMDFSRLTIKSAVSEHGGNYKCTFESDDFGHNLTVVYAAAIKLKGEFSHTQPCLTTNITSDNCRVGTLYEKFTLKCVNDGGPWNSSLAITWYYSKDGGNVKGDNYVPLKGTEDGRVKVSDDRIEISQLSSQETTYYACKVTIKKTISDKEELVPIAQQIFEIQAPPITTPIVKDITVVEGHTINVTCAVTGKASHVVWKFGEVNFVNGSDNGRVTLKEFRGVPGATLLISQANSTTDRGQYSCTAVSQSGNSSIPGLSFVRVKSKYAALGPFLGICAEVIILCTIILIYEKKRDKTELEESDTDQGPETKSSPDHGQDSVRYRK